MHTAIQEANREASLAVDFKNIRLIFSDIYPRPVMIENEAKKIIVLGSPIYGGRINHEQIKEMLLKRKTEDFIKEINGSFLFAVYDKAESRLSVASDRFASVPFYYRIENGSFFGATNYSNIWRSMRGRHNFKIREEAFYEFIYMRRLFGSKTYDHDTNFLNSASIVVFKALTGTGCIFKYWQPDCNIKELPLDENARKLASLIGASFKRATSDPKRFGLLLSGGLDSRAILAASDRELSCITTCEYKNNEYLVANELSRAKHCRHIFVEKPKDYYASIIDRAVYLGSAMSIYANAHFFNLEESVKDNIDVFLHGYAFDFLFRGKYLPNTIHPLLEKVTYKRRFIPLLKGSKSIAEEFIDNISYRLKLVKPEDILNHRSRKKMTDSLYYSIKGITDEAKTLSDDPYKWWDYCCFHNISRHYSWLNITSIRTFKEERTIAFDNDLFDFFWSLDPASLLNSRIFLRAISLMDPAVFKVRYANTNLNLGEPSIVTGGKIIINKILKETRLNKIFKNALPPPSARERSWPIDSAIVRDNPGLRKLASELCNPEALEELSFLNMDTVRRCVKEHLDGKRSYTNFVLTLITIKRFLELSR